MKGFDVFMIDPFVSFHSVLENDNGCMDLLLKEGLGGIASRTNSAGEVFHHPGKPKARTGGDDGRRRPWSVSDHLGGAQRPSSQLHGTRRSTQARHRRGRAATPHSDGERQSQHGPPRQASWFRLEVEKLANGDEIACASPWKPPDPLKGVATADMHKCRELARTGAYRLDSRSTNWVGYMSPKSSRSMSPMVPRTIGSTLPASNKSCAHGSKTRCSRPKSGRTKTARSAPSSCRANGRKPRPRKSPSSMNEDWRKPTQTGAAPVLQRSAVCASAPVAPVPYKTGDNWSGAEDPT
jgi:hypothetical protein